jgi:hypothetical protein
VLLAVQAVILVLGVLVCASAGLVSGPILSVRGNRNELHSFRRKEAIIVMVGAAFWSTTMLRTPYQKNATPMAPLKL